MSTLLRFRPATAALLALGAICLSDTSCTKQDQAKVTAAANSAYDETKAAMARTWDKVKANTWDKRDEFAASAKSLGAKMEDQVRDLRTQYENSSAEAKRKAAMEDLKKSQADYRQKVDALGTATAETWDAAKKNVIEAWDKLQARYAQAKADREAERDRK
jgi:hypothetical protein